MRCGPSTWEARALAFLPSIMGHIFLGSLGYIEFIIKSCLQKLSAKDYKAQCEHMAKEKEIRKGRKGGGGEGKGKDGDDDDDEKSSGAQADLKLTSILLPQSRTLGLQASATIPST